MRTLSADEIEITYTCKTWEFLGELLMYGNDVPDLPWDLGEFISRRAREVRLSTKRDRPNEKLTLIFGPKTRPILAKAEALLPSFPIQHWADNTHYQQKRSFPDE